MGHAPRTLDDRPSTTETRSTGSTRSTRSTSSPRPAGAGSTTPDDLVIDSPVLADGAAMWRIARDSGTLDLNSSYAYVLWARDFAATTRVARADGETVGFVTGFRRPEAPERLFVWQVAVDASHRGRRIAARMLDALLDDLVAADPPVEVLETTISADNIASTRLFTALAERRGARHEVRELFAAADFPDAHEAEPLHVIDRLRPPG